MNTVPFKKTIMALLVAGLSQLPALADENPYYAAVDADDSAPAVLPPKATDFDAAEKELSPAIHESNPSGEAALIETSHPYLLPRLFTIPTAYSLQSFELRFGGQGNIHSTLANMNTQTMKASMSIGLGGIVELGYQLDEYYTVENYSDKILMGYFKLGLLKESKWLPAVSVSASKNLRTSFHAKDSYDYDMDEDLYEVVASKAFTFGDNMISVHPGVQVIRDRINSVNQLPAFSEPEKLTKINPRLGLSWQTRPKTLFMYELKMLHPTEVATFGTGNLGTHVAVENNLGVRYYLRNWLCIDTGIRHYYDTETRDDDMKLHANFVGVIPLAKVYQRLEGYFKK